MKPEKNTQIPEFIAIGNLQFELGTGQLKDSDGNIVHMRRQSADVLTVLCENAGETVSKELLLDRVWKGIVTTDDSLVKCISDIRRVVGRNTVETFPKKGYRLLPISVKQTKPEQDTIKRSLWIKLLGCCAVFTIPLVLVWSWFSDSEAVLVQPPIVQQDKTLAVLPFTNLSDNVDIKYFSDGLAEDLTTDLSKVSGLTVISYSSSYDYPNAESGFREIAQVLGAHYLVRGTVRQSAQRVRINVSLVDPEDGFNIWSERYDRALNNPFDVQEEVVLQIVSSLSLTLEGGKTAPKRIEPDAYDTLLRGLVPLRERSRSGNTRARAFFQQALELDPGYARAHASIAVTYARETALAYSSDESKTAIEHGLESAITAIQIDPDIPHAYWALGLLNLAIGEYDNALAAGRHAIKLNRNYADGYALLAEVSLYGGHLEEGLIAIQRAKLLHPHHPPSYHWLEGHLLYLLGRFDDAQPLLEQATNLDSHFYDGFIVLIANYGKQGNLDAAQEILQNAQQINPEFELIKMTDQIHYRSMERHDALLDGLTKARLP